MGMNVGAKGGVKAEINVTPMVDVVLVLLIIFMVVTPMLQKGQAVTTPVTMAPEKVPEDAKQLLVAVTEKEQISIDQEHEKIPAMAMDAFEAKIKEAFQRNPGASIVIKADSRLTYGFVKNVMLKVRDAGFQQVGLVTLKRQQTMGG
jgi:biopolymer transport protein ExbD